MQARTPSDDLGADKCSQAWSRDDKPKKNVMRYLEHHHHLELHLLRQRRQMNGILHISPILALQPWNPPPPYPQR